MKTPQSAQNQEEPAEVEPLTPLQLADCKTGFSGGNAGMICAAPSGGHVRIVGDPQHSYCYHVMSRTTGGDFLFGDQEKEAFLKIMWRQARFSGIKILTYCIMDNHFHLLIRVPSREKFNAKFEAYESKGRYEERPSQASEDGEERLLDHLRTLYSKAYVNQLRAELAHMRANGMARYADEQIEKFKARFCNLEIFVKELKARYTRWFNKTKGRSGTLWMGRYKSVMVESSNKRAEHETGEDFTALHTIAAYIDLNPVRAGIVDDPKDYRWCGYSAALAGSKRCRYGLCEVMRVPQTSWQKHGHRYRIWLLEDAAVTNEKAKSKLEKAKANGGKLGLAEIFQHKVKYFSDGLAIGGKSFINQQFKIHRKSFGAKRQEGAKSIQLENSTEALYSLRRFS
ncbi:transposase [Persicirhabdus sediminis]|uniref:Transposase n=1 Tax=Persicirhabdus sediminis TaxID=454144 RepID=A0A8J7SJZ3_9BACT|nr:transposase [Persicirhabdus sediminis]MBK1792495.1 transposase [Persicirhabdus sediminis]